MGNRKFPKAAGSPFLVAGIVFLAVAVATDRMTFIGAGLGFVALGIILARKARQDRVQA